MIFGISGRPGGGKSYEGVKNHVIPTLREGRKIITNLPLLVDHFKASLGSEVADLIEVIDGEFHNFGDGNRPFSKAEHFLRYNTWRNDKNQGPVFFVDECHLAMPAGTTQKELLEFLSLHRHYGFDIYLITQDFRKVHRDIRAMVEINYRCIKKTALGQSRSYIVKVQQGAEARGEVTNTYERNYESWVFKFYQSHTMTNGKQVDEAYAKDLPVWWKKKRVIFGAIAIVFGLVSSISNLKDLLFKNSNAQQAKVQQSEAKQSQGQQGTYSATQGAVSAQNAANQKPVPLGPSPQGDHPFKKLQIHVAGSYKDLREKIVFFVLSYNGQQINQISSVDLMMAGYTVKVLADCVVRLEYGGDYASFVVCDHPTMSVPLDQTVAATADVATVQ